MPTPYAGIVESSVWHSSRRGTLGGDPERDDATMHDPVQRFAWLDDRGHGSSDRWIWVRGGEVVVRFVSAVIASF